MIIVDIVPSLSLFISTGGGWWSTELIHLLSLYVHLYALRSKICFVHISTSDKNQSGNFDVCSQVFVSLLKFTLIKKCILDIIYLLQCRILRSIIT